MNPFWIKIEGVRLAIAPRPRGGDWLEDDVRLLQRAGVDVIVSALTPVEAEELGLLGRGSFLPEHWPGVPLFSDRRQVCSSLIK